MESLIRGAFAGTVATALMSAVMLGARRLGITGTLPPEKITSKMVRRLGIHADRGQQDALAAGLHFAFGAAAGGAFGVIAPRVPGPRVPLGMAYGAAIWGVSYMGWVPSMGLMPRADLDERGRQAVMLAGHLVFGATLGLLAGRRPRRPENAELEEAQAEDSSSPHA
jgi:hypothetical protein